MIKIQSASKNAPLRVAFVGGSVESAIGNTHKIACQMDDRWDIVAACFSRSREANLETAKQWQIPQDRVYSTAEMLYQNERGNIDAVVILTPTPQHCEHVIAALDSGYSVICEKAIASSSADAEKMLAAARRNNKLLLVTFNYSGYPMMRELKAMIEAQKLGKLQQIQVEMPQEGFVRENHLGEKSIPQDWRLQDSSIATVSLDLGVHLHHIVCFLSGNKPISVIGDQASFGCFNDVIDSVGCLVRYSNNLRCQMWYSKAAIGQRNGLRVRVFGEKGSAEWFQATPETLVLNTVDGGRQTLDRSNRTLVANEKRYDRFKIGHPAGFIEAFANLYSDMADCLSQFNETGKCDSYYGFSALQAQEGLWLFEALERSSKSERWELVS
jgi:predicted dehydrogenase